MQGKKKYPTFNQILDKYKRIRKMNGEEVKLVSSYTWEKLLQLLEDCLDLKFIWEKTIPNKNIVQYLFCNCEYRLELYIDVKRVQLHKSPAHYTWQETTVESFSLYSTLDLFYGECLLEDPEVVDE